MSDYRVKASDATQEQWILYLTKVQNLKNVQPNTSLDKLRAKGKELGFDDDDYINLPDTGEADREEARLARQPRTVNIDGNTVTYTEVGYEKAKALADEVDGVLIGTDGKPMRYVDFNNWPKGTVLIPQTRDYDGKHDVPVAPNGRQMYVPRGKDVEIAEPFIDALKDAIGLEYEQVENGGAMIPREVQRHSLIVKRLPEYTIVAPARSAAA
jgi:hypothetical protein